MRIEPTDVLNLETSGFEFLLDRCNAIGAHPALTEIPQLPILSYAKFSFKQMRKEIKVVSDDDNMPSIIDEAAVF